MSLTRPGACLLLPNMLLPAHPISMLVALKGFSSYKELGVIHGFMLVRWIGLNIPISL